MQDENTPGNTSKKHSQMHVQIGGAHYKKLALQPVQIAHVLGYGLLPLGIKYVRSKENLQEDIAKMLHVMQLEQELVSLDQGLNQARRASPNQAKKMAIYLSQFPYINQQNCLEFFLAWHERRYVQAEEWFNKGVLNVG